ncbi:MAG: peptide chain release factor N(5)-glutamine methyltransferase [Ruminococcus sp.]|nr:peptide chain release factor N(5)-glutamine methyltransferase [Ruminococcus sp.]
MNYELKKVSRRQLYDECVALLNAAGKESADFDVLCIFQDMLGDKNPLFLPGKEIPPGTAERIRGLVKARSEGEPLQYLLGKWEFYGIELYVGEGVLIPRPDTETLVEHTLDICREKGIRSPVIADLCSGSGCIALALERELPGAEIYAVEMSPEALAYLRKNRELNNSRIHIIEGDILSPEVISTLPEADVIVSNPPYLTAQDMTELETEVLCEPSLALFGGSDGLDYYRAIAEKWRDKLREGGIIAFEFGLGQHGDVEEILRSCGFTDISFRKDGGGIIRTASAVKH